MTRFALGLCLVVAACGTNAQGDDDTHNPGPDGPPSSGPIQPRAGSWGYSDTPVSNTCPGNVRTGEAGMFVIADVTATGFRIVPGDGTAPFTCNLSNNGAFDCPDRVKDVEDLHPTVDAVITVRAMANGVLSSATAGTGSQMATASCAGGGCTLGGAAFPCSASVSFTIHAL